MIYNISEGIKNRLQMLTKRRPKSECNTTAATMACIYTGHTIPSEGIMPEDYLMDILDSPEGFAYLQKITPGAKYNPWNDSYCIAWAVNKALGKEVCKVVKADIAKMVQHISEGGAIALGGGFLNGGTSGHFVCVVGYETDGYDDIKSIIYDDPLKGNDIKMLVEDFKEITFGGSKQKTMQFYYRS